MEQRSIDEIQEEEIQKTFGTVSKPSPRRLIVQIEGPDGVGKTTQAEMLSKALKLPIIKPTDKEDDNIEWAYKMALESDGIERYLLFAWMRAYALNSCLALDTFIMDRGPISPLVYQGLMGNTDTKMILRVEREIFKRFRFLKTIVLLADAPFSRIENDSYDKLVYSKWKEWTNAYSKAAFMWSEDPVFIFCDKKTPEAIHEEIMENFRELGWSAK